jgi:hypothetical protein
MGTGTVATTCLIYRRFDKMRLAAGRLWTEDMALRRMKTKQRAVKTGHFDQDKLLDRIAQRYEQLDEKLTELEERLREWEGRENPESAAPRKPR